MQTEVIIFDCVSCYRDPYGQRRMPKGRRNGVEIQRHGLKKEEKERKSIAPQSKKKMKRRIKK